MLFAGNFVIRGWARCDGQLLPIAQYSALFSILGTTYGGDGRSTFGLPDLRGRVAIGDGTGPGLSDYRLGMRSGQEQVTLNSTQIPAHSHNVQGHVGAGDETNPGPGSYVARATNDLYAESAGVVMGPTTNAGSGLPHNNMQPYLALTYLIALQGIFPSSS